MMNPSPKSIFGTSGKEVSQARMMAQTLKETLDRWRKQQKLPLSQLAKRAGVHRATLARWYSGHFKPSVAELESVMNILAIPEPERRICWLQLDTPRSLAYLQREQQELPLAQGDLLRALRVRVQKTQTEVARLAGFSQGLLARWENNTALPDVEKLHTLCFVLNASVEEVAALTMRAYHNQAPLPQDMEALYASFNNLVYWNYSSHKDLFFLAHSAQFLRLMRKGYANNEMLARVWGRHAQFVQSHQGRDEDAILYGSTALSLLEPHTVFDGHLTAAAIATAEAWRRKSGPMAAYQFLHPWKERMTTLTCRHWVESNLAHYLSEAGYAKTAHDLSKRVFQEARDAADEYLGDFLHRMWNYVDLLLEAGDAGNALDILERYSIFPSTEYCLADHEQEARLFTRAQTMLKKDSRIKTSFV